MKNPCNECLVKSMCLFLNKSNKLTKIDGFEMDNKKFTIIDENGLTKSYKMIDKFYYILESIIDKTVEEIDKIYTKEQCPYLQEWIKNKKET